MGIMSNISTAIDLVKRYGPMTMAGYTKNRLHYGFLKNVLGKRFVEKDIHNYRMILDSPEPG